ncbi:hypothetical protein SEA_HIRKO_25 [Arthrobacter phage Hirko]|nr:hypothetical protein SEA_HIRKO_25 [Arthrobacter phage Hirko]
MKPLTLTSSTHAFAYSTYGIQAGFGLVMLVGGVKVSALSAFLLLPVIGLILLASGLIGLFAITAAHRRVNPDPGLRLELVAAWGLGVTNLFFAVSLLYMYGLEKGLTTQIYVLGGAVSCGFRLWQIRRDRIRLREALAQARQADDATLAEPPTADK